MRLTVATLVTAFAALASAWTQPNYNNPPSGNPIYTPSLGELVPAGKPFEITWGPTTTGTITLVLLRGPSTNVVPLYAIAQEIPNTGSFVWTPSTDLVPDTTHYGLLLVVDADGEYQYSTQFGISNPNPQSSTTPTSSTTASSTTGTGSSTSSSTTPGTGTGTTTTSCTTTSTQGSSPVSVTTPTSTKTVTLIGTGTGHTSVPFVSPTKTATLPGTLYSTVVSTRVPSSPPSSSTSPPLHTVNAAVRSGAHMGGLGVVAGVIAMLAF
jgi:hypothetical protein